jgi:hypothetical protein
MDSSVYIRRGFDPDELLKIPSLDGEWELIGWDLFRTSHLGISDFYFTDTPRRRFLSPRGLPAQEFTVIIPIEMDKEAMNFLRANTNVLPGFYFASIGENWEIYFNGTLVRSEMHLDEMGQIIERRVWWNVHFPISSSLVVQGTNILAVRIVGDPSYRFTGFGYIPNYFDDYRNIISRHRNLSFLILCGIYIFTGIYYLTIFLSVRNKRESFNFFFSISSFLLFIYTITNHSIIHELIPNSDITQGLMYISIGLAVPALGMFFDLFVRGKITSCSLTMQ